MSKEESGKSKIVAGALALCAGVLTLISFGLLYGKVQWGAILICSLIAGLVLEGFSVGLSAAGYFSMAAPVYILLMFSNSVVKPELLGGFLPLCVGVALAGVCSLARLVVPLPDDHTFQTRLAGIGVNVIRVAVVGAAMLGSQKAELGALVSAVAGYAAWMLSDQVVGFVHAIVEEEKVQELWQEFEFQGKAVLALAPIAGLVASHLPQEKVQSQVLPIVGVALLGMAFRETARVCVDEIRLKDQEIMDRQLKKLTHDVKRYQESIEDSSTENAQMKDELTSVYQMAENLGASTDVEETLNVVSTMIKKLRIPFQSCVIFLFKGSTLTPVHSETPYKDVLQMSHLLQLEETLIKDVVETKRAKIKPEMSTSSEGRIFKNERSVMCVPLIVSKDTVGVIYVGSVNPKTHNEGHLDQLKMISAFASPSIKTALLFEDKDKKLVDEIAVRKHVEAKNAQLAELQNMGQRMGATLNTAVTISVVSESLKKMVDEAQSVILFTPDSEQSGGHALKAEFSDTPYTDYVNNLALRDDEGLLGKAISSRKTLLVEDTEMYDVQNLLGSEQSVVIAPLVSAAGDDEKDGGGEQLLGCLYVGAASRNAFTEEHRSLIETVSYQTAMAIKNARLYEQTQQQALTDGLTGLYTHRLFQEKISEELEWAERHGQQIVLVMVDCDNFKTYNDTLGHPAGDALLKEVASLLKDKVRSTDIVSRYGGDEFALLLKQTSKEDAMRMCERIREAFQLRFGGNAVQVTSSIGLACYPGDAITKQDLAKAADDALYVSKRGGRNKVSASKTLKERSRKPIVEEVLARAPH